MNNSPSATLAHRIIERAASAPCASFLADRLGRLTNGGFLAGVAARREQLAALVKPGDAVLVSSGRGLAFFVDLVAVWTVGGVFVPLGTSVSAKHARHILELTRPVTAILSKTQGEELRAGITVLPDPRPASGGGHIAVDARKDAIGAVCFTSGSTGLPKGVVLRHAALLGNAQASLEALAPRPDDRMFFAIPFNFMSALSHFFVMGIAGSEIFATEEKLLLADLFNAIGGSGANCFGGSPLQLRWIAECSRTQPINLRWVMSSGDHLPVHVIDLVRSVLPGTRIHTVYGLTELGGRFCFLPPADIERHKGSVGRPIRGLAFTIRDEQEGELLPGEAGEVYVTGEYLFDEYLKNDASTRKALTPRGFRTGDIGLMDPDGHLHLLGRADDVFKCHGEKVSAVPIAEALMRTGLFADVVVIAEEHPVLGSVPKALVVLSPGTTFDQSAVLRQLRAQLPSTHIPRTFQVVSSLPRTGSGKLQRVLLAKILRGEETNDGELRNP